MRWVSCSLNLQFRAGSCKLARSSCSRSAWLRLAVPSTASQAALKAPSQLVRPRAACMQIHLSQPSTASQAALKAHSQLVSPEPPACIIITVKAALQKPSTASQAALKAPLQVVSPRDACMQTYLSLVSSAKAPDRYPATKLHSACLLQGCSASSCSDAHCCARTLHHRRLA